MKFFEHHKFYLKHSYVAHLTRRRAKILAKLLNATYIRPGKLNLWKHLKAQLQSLIKEQVQPTFKNFKIRCKNALYEYRMRQPGVPIPPETKRQNLIRAFSAEYVEVPSVTDE